MRKRKTGCKRVYLQSLMVFGLMISISLSSVVFSDGKTETITGRLSLIGNEPFTRLVCRSEAGAKEQSPETFVLEGESELLAELLNLQGAKVLIEGSSTDRLSEYRLPIFEVTGYRLLAVDGSRPVIGLLTERKGKLILETEDGKSYLLSGQLPPKLKEYVGGKLWLTGEIKKGVFSWLTGRYGLIPSAFGVIRRP